MPRISEFLQQELSSTAWSFAKLHFRYAPLSKAISSAAIHQMEAQQYDADPQALSSFSWSMATMSYLDEQLLDAISCAAIPNISAFKTQEISNIAWALSTLQVYHHQPLVDALSAAALAKIT